MRRWQPACLCVLLCCLGPREALAFDATPRILPAQGTVQAAFSPWDDVEGLLVEALGTARTQIRVQAYLLTSKKIAEALIAAHRRGVDVAVLADAEQSHVDSAKLGLLAAAGIPVWLETRYQNAHNKVILIDPASAAATVVTGSFNFTWTAQHKNAENVLILRKNPEIAAQYALNWSRHLQQATAFNP
jgi:phosphatidylserine/phosphatidylglycerophosphate/cardiolipin synthase-like enzyme